MTTAILLTTWLTASVIAAPIIGRRLARAACPCGDHQ